MARDNDTLGTGNVLEYDDIRVSVFQVTGSLETLIDEIKEKPMLLEIPVVRELAEKLYGAGRAVATIQRVSKYRPYDWPKKDGAYIDSLCDEITRLTDEILNDDKT